MPLRNYSLTTHSPLDQPVDWLNSAVVCVIAGCGWQQVYNFRLLVCFVLGCSLLRGQNTAIWQWAFRLAMCSGSACNVGRKGMDCSDLIVSMCCWETTHSPAPDRCRLVIMQVRGKPQKRVEVIEKQPVGFIEVLLHQCQWDTFWCQQWLVLGSYVPCVRREIE